MMKPSKTRKPRSMRTPERLAQFLAKWLRSLQAAAPAPVSEPRTDLIVRLEVYVEALCPCGSQHLHRLSLNSTALCARCGRTLAVRSLEYFRPHVEAIPDAHVTVGYVVTRETLARQPASSVLH